MEGEAEVGEKTYQQADLECAKDIEHVGTINTSHVDVLRAYNQE